MQIKTVTLQNLIRKVSKCGTNKNIGITEYYYLEGGKGKEIDFPLESLRRNEL